MVFELLTLKNGQVNKNKLYNKRSILPTKKSILNNDIHVKDWLTLKIHFPFFRIDIILDWSVNLIVELKTFNLPKHK